MTYPPQQPGPYGQDPWGQQPDPWGQQQQPDPYGQSPWGQQPGYPMGPPPPPKKKGGLMAALIIVAILVVGGGGTGLYFLLSKDEETPGGGGGSSKEDGPRAAADAFTEELQKLVNMESIKDLTVEPLKPYLCGDDYTRLDEDLKEEQEDLATATNQPSQSNNPSIKLSVKDFKETDDGATFNLNREVEGASAHDQKLNVVEEDENWVVCGLFEDQEPTSPPSTGGGGNSGEIPNPIPTT